MLLFIVLDWTHGVKFPCLRCLRMRIMSRLFRPASTRSFLRPGWISCPLGESPFSVFTTVSIRAIMRHRVNDQFKFSRQSRRTSLYTTTYWWWRALLVRLLLSEWVSEAAYSSKISIDQISCVPTLSPQHPPNQCWYRAQVHAYNYGRNMTASIEAIDYFLDISRGVYTMYDLALNPSSALLFIL